MNRTAALRELFDKSSPYISGCENFVVIGALRAHPFNRALILVVTAADGALRTTRLRIRATVRAMEECTPAIAELESALLLQEAELLSVSNTIKDLLTSIREAEEQLEKKKSGWDTVLFPTKEETKLLSSVKPSMQFLQHLQAALEIIEGAVGRSRLRLALCKEELVLYKQEMFAFARAGVLSCLDPARNSKSNKENSVTEKGDTSGNGNSSNNDNNNNNTMGLLYPKPMKGNTSSAVAVVSVVDRVIKGAAKTVSSAPLPASTRVFSLMRSGVGGVGVGGVGVGGINSLFQRSSLVETTSPKFVYTAEEEERLTQANALLEEQQKEASAEDAKAVEASVRELSQLTSLMNEQVMQQNEQFSILLKNTEAAQNNMRKGVGEVGKTLKQFWNSTRQLIACIWVSIFILLIANWIIR
ncbi:syntaxin 1B/2/3 [Trypanosoma theileri]|uniref:Syntaxin 1B/2/3 n=1 Tax=Trypanosoma theileri TaxID=67003 RepID=A0A1X0P0B8_9TRYP|nr:syntaxin 1B/2/3 [Trypanosoma theileri]ORC90396.1 syntaxin 1B/2/3 [Trypanosoma theileri]